MSIFIAAVLCGIPAYCLSIIDERQLMGCVCFLSLEIFVVYLFIYTHNGDGTFQKSLLSVEEVMS